MVLNGISLGGSIDSPETLIIAINWGFRPFPVSKAHICNWTTLTIFRLLYSSHALDKQYIIFGGGSCFSSTFNVTMLPRM
jgi:hypothetical protein